MTITNGDIIRMTLNYIAPGAGTMMNVFHYGYVGGDIEDDAALDSLETWITDDWGASWADMASSNAELDFASFETVNVAGEVLRNLGVRAINLAGNLAFEVLPAAVSVYIQGNTAFAGVRGSKYVPGLAESLSDDGVLTATGLAQAAFLLLDYLSTVNAGAGNNFFPVVRSIKEAGFPRLVTAGAIALIPAYQRRRKLGVGI